jgi:hypothetical protein
VNETNCPNCGAVYGEYLRCAYCGTIPQSRIAPITYDCGIATTYTGTGSSSADYSGGGGGGGSDGNSDAAASAAAACMGGCF